MLRSFAQDIYDERHQFLLLTKGRDEPAKTDEDVEALREVYVQSNGYGFEVYTNESGERRAKYQFSTESHFAIRWNGVEHTEQEWMHLFGDMTSELQLGFISTPMVVSMSKFLGDLLSEVMDNEIPEKRLVRLTKDWPKPSLELKEAWGKLQKYLPPGVDVMQDNDRHAMSIVKVCQVVPTMALTSDMELCKRVIQSVEEKWNAYEGKRKDHIADIASLKEYNDKVLAWNKTVDEQITRRQKTKVLLKPILIDWFFPTRPIRIVPDLKRYVGSFPSGSFFTRSGTLTIAEIEALNSKATGPLPPPTAGRTFITDSVLQLTHVVDKAIYEARELPSLDPTAPLPGGPAPPPPLALPPPATVTTPPSSPSPIGFVPIRPTAIRPPTPVLTPEQELVRRYLMLNFDQVLNGILLGSI